MPRRICQRLFDLEPKLALHVATVLELKADHWRYKV